MLGNLVLWLILPPCLRLLINVSLKICGKNNRWDKLLSREYCVYAKTENVKTVDFRKKDAKKKNVIL